MPSKRAVENIIAGLDLEQSNRTLADHWLSLWEGDALPPRAKLNPAKLKSFLPGMLLFDVVPDRSITVRLAGTGYRYALQNDPTGTDWIAAAPESHRANRLKAFSTIARGAGQSITKETSLNTPLIAPIAAGATVGQYTVRVGDEVVARVPLVAMEAVEEGGLWRWAIDSVKLWFED